MLNLFIVVIYFLLSISSSFAKTVNYNPDKFSDPWLASDTVGEVVRSRNSAIKMRQHDNINKRKSNDELPYSVDNSSSIHFRPVFTQVDGSCSQAAAISYCFTYEINRLRNVSAELPENQYPTHFTYNFLSDGTDIGSSIIDGFYIAKEMGCPSVKTYGGMSAARNHMMNGYEKYRAAMRNRVRECYEMRVFTEDDLNVMKNWLDNHLSGSFKGGVFAFNTGMQEATIVTLPDESEDSGAKVAVDINFSVGHSMTIAGYNDNIMYDYNNDGEFTNDIDLNGDGIIDIRDWERGAVLVVNSWGETWGNRGKIYLMYKVLVDNSYAGGPYDAKLFAIDVLEDFEPLVTSRLEMNYSLRNKISIDLGISDPSKDEPETVKNLTALNYLGGSWPYMCEIGLDFSSFYLESTEESKKKFYLILDEIDDSYDYFGEIKKYETYVDDELSTQLISEASPLSDSSRHLFSSVEEVSLVKPKIINYELPSVKANNDFSFNLEAESEFGQYWNIDYYVKEDCNNSYSQLTEENSYADDWWDGFLTVNLDFEFPFFDKKYSQIHVSTNGAVNFSDTDNAISSYGELTLATAIGCFMRPMILQTDFGDDFKIHKENDSVTINWKARDIETGLRVRASLKLSENGDIELCYPDDNEILLWAGISNGEDYFKRTVINSNKDTSVKYSINDVPSFINLSSDGILSGVANDANRVYNIPVQVKNIYSTTDRAKVRLSVLPEYSDSPVISKLTIAPNPFHHETSILVDVGKEDSITQVIIYNLKGQKVKSLINGYCTKGKHLLRWSGRDSNNQEVASGSYICKFKNGDKIATSKITLIRKSKN